MSVTISLQRGGHAIQAVFLQHAYDDDLAFVIKCANCRTVFRKVSFTGARDPHQIATRLRSAIADADDPNAVCTPPQPDTLG